ncbi:hypothetical protein LX36DRAFT_750738, partial [Colletotrichum falcatum]
MSTDEAFRLPKEWMDDDQNTGANINRFLADARKREAVYDSLGVPCFRVTTDAGNKLQPRQWANLQAVNAKDMKDNLDT